MLALEVLLQEAASAADWSRAVVHRCAWCQRLATPDGHQLDRASLSAATVFTDGMCQSCAAAALQRLRHRRARFSRPR